MPITAPVSTDRSSDPPRGKRTLGRVEGRYGRHRDGGGGVPRRVLPLRDPHKTAYRPLPPAIPLAVPGRPRIGRRCSCTCTCRSARCGAASATCSPGPARRRELVDGLPGALRRQASAVATPLVAPASYARAAIGGGTPDLPDAGRARAGCSTSSSGSGRRPAGRSRCRSRPRRRPRRPTGSPSCASAASTRVSIGVQSFVDAEARAAGRPQHRGEVDRRRSTGSARPGSRSLNIDLIYGIDGQTARDLASSLDARCPGAPEELYLYPLYVRPLTGLGRTRSGADPTWDAQRLRLYRARPRRCCGPRLRAGVDAHVPPRPTRPTSRRAGYCCQDDGMVGLGLRRPVLHPEPALLVRLRGRRRRGPGDHRRLPGPPPTTSTAPSSGSRSTPASSAAASCSVAAARRGRRPPRRYAARFGTAVDDDFPQLRSLSPARLADRRRAPAGAHRRGAGRGPTPSARGSSPRGSGPLIDGGHASR